MPGWVLWYWRRDEIEDVFVGGQKADLEWALVEARKWLDLLAT